ncbi:hypothetical protein PGB90_008135 [Kerria lacca]
MLPKYKNNEIPICEFSRDYLFFLLDWFVRFDKINLLRLCNISMIFIVKKL